MNANDLYNQYGLTLDEVNSTIANIDTEINNRVNNWLGLSSNLTSLKASNLTNLGLS